MKPIKIITANAAKIETALLEINGRATSFTIRRYSDVTDAVAIIDAKLSSLPVKERTGATASYKPIGPTASAYKYDAKSTVITVERRASGWFLTGVSEGYVRPRQPISTRITISPAQRNEIARRAVEGFTVKLATVAKQEQAHV